jgi:chaperonin cofactor prefoldin
MIDQELQAIATQRVKIEQQRNDYLNSKEAIEAWLSTIKNLPPDEPLKREERQQGLFLANRLAEFSPAWMALIQAQPAETAVPTAYVDWLSQILDYIDSDILTLEGQIESLDRQRAKLKESYDLETSYSLGLSQPELLN